MKTLIEPLIAPANSPLARRSGCLPAENANKAGLPVPPGSVNGGEKASARAVGAKTAPKVDADSFALRWNEWAWRLAVVLHAAKHGDDAHLRQVQPETASAAIGLASWFADHQMAMLEISRASTKAKQADRVLGLLDLRRKLKWSKNAVSARSSARLQLLLARRHQCPAQPDGAGGRIDRQGLPPARWRPLLPSVHPGISPELTVYIL